ncbi:MAG: transposase, partial [Candidatus Aminicenantes bacterium]|nr:transposase [Candidatus Aminicenantes bacterium]
LALARFWEIADPAEAISYLKRWYFWATHSRLQPVIHAARTIKRIGNSFFRVAWNRRLRAQNQPFPS